MKFFRKAKKCKIGWDWPEVTGMVGNRFAIILVGNLTPFYNFIIFLYVFWDIDFKNKLGVFFFRNSTVTVKISRDITVIT